MKKNNEVSFAAVVCKNGAECKFDECCLKPLFSNKTLCRPKIKAKQLCLFKPNYFKHKTGIYELSCPCEPGYKCVLDEDVECRKQSDIIILSTQQNRAMSTKFKGERTNKYEIIQSES
ncbi:hypothetical protein NPIL_23521 [Nephila pilipes]|uniref:Uncharacterized protein n=1 Tax=Nephila pilipes TaxID=299642 RepID=A0A8X6I7N9_NEPPI|nr:hypothetical protein NPIL_23521 [Nephila pilipes]